MISNRRLNRIAGIAALLLAAAVLCASAARAQDRDKIIEALRAEQEKAVAEAADAAEKVAAAKAQLDAIKTREDPAPAADVKDAQSALDAAIEKKAGADAKVRAIKEAFTRLEMMGNGKPPAGAGAAPVATATPSAQPQAQDQGPGSFVGALSRAEAEVADAEAKVAKARAELDAGMARLDETKKRAAQDLSLAGEVAGAETAVKDARDSLDAAMARLAAARAKASEMQDEMKKLRAAGILMPVASASAIPAPSATPPADAAQAQKWWEVSVAQMAKRHFIALAHTQFGGRPGNSFRYDRFNFDNSPAIERAVATDGAMFARTPGKEWVALADWGGDAPPIDAKRAAELDRFVEMALGPLRPVQPDSPDGPVVWRLVRDVENTFARSREKPVDGVVYPRFEFGENKKYADGVFARTVTISAKWNGDPEQVQIDYFHPPAPASPDAAMRPEGAIAAALRDAETRPMLVDVIVQGKGGRVRGMGIIAGKDFDLTVVKAGIVVREIAVGDDFWTSNDGGKTWEKQKETDRTDYNLARTAMGRDYPGAPLLWLQRNIAGAGDNSGRTIETRGVIEGYEESGGATPNDKAYKTPAGGTLRRYSLKGPLLEGNMDFLTYWLEVKEGRPVLRRITTMWLPGQKIAGPLYAEFGDVPAAPSATAQGVLPPPGNPAAVPGELADELLAAAVKAMGGATWWADLRMARQTQTDKDTWGDPQPVQRVQGLFSGKDFDLTNETAGGARMRGIGVGGKVWGEGHIAGGAWSEDHSGEESRSIYNTVHGPLEEAFTSAFYVVAGRETHKDETWLHIRQVAGQDGEAAMSREYWLLLDKAGKPVAVRRCTWTSQPSGAIGGRITKYRYTVDFTPPREGEKIAPPAAVMPAGGGMMKH